MPAMLLDDLQVPIVLAPLAGGPCTPELVAAVADAGAFGFLAGGYLSRDGLAGSVERLRSLSSGPFGVNVFVPPRGAADPAVYAGYVRRLQAWADERRLPIGEPLFDDDDFDAKIELLVTEAAAVVSFTFGMPGVEVVERLHDAGSEVWATVTTPEEAVAAAGGGADVLVVQGSEAGGHRGSFSDEPRAPSFSTLSLVQLAAAAGRPLVAAGGIMSGAAVAAARAAGARAAQLGTAFLLCPEAGTSAPHRDALRRADAPTRLTRAFTGRPARGIVNMFMEQHDAHAVSAYPEIHHLTRPLRRDAAARGDASMINLWAGEAYPLVREMPAAQLVEQLAGEMEAAGRAAGG
jgi:nitronate monooxygenase